MTQRAYKFRFYPTEGKKQILAKTFGGVRYIYNCGWRLKTEAYYQTGNRLYYKDLSTQLTGLKRQPETGNGMAPRNIQRLPPQALRHLDRAFINLFAGRIGYPQSFHKKRGKQSTTYGASAFKWDGEHLTLAKMFDPLANA